MAAPAAAQTVTATRATGLVVDVTQASSIQSSTVVVPINKVTGAIGDQDPPLARDLCLWLGGVAAPRSGQRAGDYTGVVTVFSF